MSRAIKYLFASAAIVALVVIGLLSYDVVIGTRVTTMAWGPATQRSRAPTAASTPPPSTRRATAAWSSSSRRSRRRRRRPRRGGAQALGSGFVVSTDGTILTNAHVVMENGVKAKSVTVSFKQGGPDGKQVKAKVVGFDPPATSPCSRSTPRARAHAAPAWRLRKVAIGQWVVAIGNPLGFDFSLTQGIVSGIGRDLQAPNGAVIPNGIQTDAAINQGNSGGPLLDQTATSSASTSRSPARRAASAASGSRSPSTRPSRSWSSS